MRACARAFFYARLSAARERGKGHPPRRNAEGALGAGWIRHRRSGDERDGQVAQLGGVFAAEGELLQLLLQGGVGLLSAGEVVGRETGPELVEVLEQGTLGG